MFPDMSIDAAAFAAVAAGAIRVACALIFAVGALHKWRRGAAFAGVLEAYRVLPRGWSMPVAKALPFLELAAGALLLLPLGAPGVIPALAMMAMMSLAVAINLARGRRDIECGCGGAKGQRLSAGLLLRNAALLLLLALAARPLDADPPGAAGAALMLAAGFMLAAFHFGASQLLANAQEWRLIVEGRRA